MGYLMTANKVQQLTLASKYLGQNIINVMYYGSSSAGDAWPDAPLIPDSQVFMQKWAAQVLPSLQAVQSDQLAYVSLTVREVSGWRVTGGSPGYGVWVTNVDERFLLPAVGLLPGDTLASYIGVTIRNKTLFPGRKWNSSNRWSGIRENTSDPADGNLLAAGVVAGWQALADALRAPLIPDLAGQPLNVFDRKVFSLKSLHDAYPTQPLTSLATDTYAAQITTSAPNAYFGSQVSRKLHHGS